MMFVITKNNSKYLHVSDTKTIQNAFMYTSVVVKQEVWKTPKKKILHIPRLHARTKTNSIYLARTTVFNARLISYLMCFNLLLTQQRFHCSPSSCTLTRS